MCLVNADGTKVKCIRLTSDAVDPTWNERNLTPIDSSVLVSEFQDLCHCNVAAGATSDVADKRQLVEQEAAAKEAAASRRRALGSDVVNQALVITKLEEEFSRKQLMGYRMEADKRRKDLLVLVRENRAVLYRDGWSEVDKAYRQILPGLTVYEASYIQALLSYLRK